MLTRKANVLLNAVLASAGLFCMQGASALAAGADQASAGPVLVELFTSEGCSSCPPADALLASLQAKSSGGSIVVLSEHVDYWDHDGWRDPFSSPAATERQSAYADRFHLGSPYTPQMIVDGQYQFVGSDRSAAARAILSASAKEKVQIRIVGAEWSGDTLVAKISVGEISASLRNAKIYAVLADDKDTTQVEGGENSGRMLTHVSVVRVLQPIGALAGDPTTGSSRTVQLQGHRQHGKIHLVVFAQQPDLGPVVGVGSLAL